MDFIRDTDIMDVARYQKGRCLGGTMTLGELIRSRRKEKGWTQEYLGEIVGKDQHYISQVENSRIQRPAQDVLIAIARALEIPASDFLVSEGWTPRESRDATVVAASEDIDVDLSDPLLVLWAAHGREFTPEERRLLEDLIRVIVRNKRERQNDVA